MATLKITGLVRSRVATSSNRLSIQSRSSSDLVIERRRDAQRTPFPVMARGPPTGGRSSSSGHTVTIFGCTGFLGRTLTQKIAKAGSRVIVPYRDEDDKRPLKVMGDLGMIVPLEWDAKNFDQTYECVKHSDVVYNLVGRDWETRNYSFTDVNASIAGRIAQVCREAKIPRLIHVSHLNASPNSPSEFYRTKYRGEQLVRQEYPEATIVRPGPMYGTDDWLLRDLAEWPIKYRLHGETRMLPVHMPDVAEAMTIMLGAPVTSTGSTFALPGPEAFTHEELLNLISFFTMRPKRFLPVIPRGIAQTFAAILNRALWWPTVNSDEILRKYISDAGSSVGLALSEAAKEAKPQGWQEHIDTNYYGVNGQVAKSWSDLDIDPGRLQDHAVKYLRMYRDTDMVDTPIETGHFKAPKRYRPIP